MRRYINKTTKTKAKFIIMMVAFLGGSFFAPWGFVRSLCITGLIFVVIGFLLYSFLSTRGYLGNIAWLGSLFKFLQEDENLKKEMVQKENEAINEISEHHDNFVYQEFVQFTKECLCNYLLARNNDEIATEALRKSSSEQFMKNYIHEIANYRRDNLSFEKPKATRVVVHDYSTSDKTGMIKAKVETTCKYVRKNELGRTLYLKEIKDYFDVVFIKMHSEGILESEDIRVNCPNCGGVIDLLHETHCSFCGTSIYKKVNIWIMDEVKQFKHDLN